MLLTRPPKIEGAALQGNKERKRKLSGGDELLKGFLHVHESMSQATATPRRYMSFVHAYQAVYSHKKRGIETRQQHLQVSKLSQRIITQK